MQARNSAAARRWLCRAPCIRIPNADVWRGRDDPTGEIAPRIHEISPVLSGPIDNFTPRILSRSQVDSLIRDNFAELNERAIWEKIGIYRCRKRRVKKVHYTEVVYPPVYGMAFEDPKKPLFVDIGSGDGKIIMLQAKRNPDMNYLGLDKRDKRIEISNQFQEVLKLKNLHFICCNATISLKTLLATYPGPVKYVTIVCPDPHLKGRFYRIRMVKRNLVEQILDVLAPGGKLFFQTEFKDVAKYLRKYCDKHLDTYLSPVDEDNTYVYDEDGWLLMNPLGVRSETEIDAVAHGQKVYRRLYERTIKEYVKVESLSEQLLCDIEAPNPEERLTKREREFNRWFSPLKPVKRFQRRLCNRLRKLPDGQARDIIMNWETYPRGWFLKLLESKRLKRIRRKKEPKPRIRPPWKRHLDEDKPSMSL